MVLSDRITVLSYLHFDQRRIHKSVRGRCGTTDRPAILTRPDKEVEPIGSVGPIGPDKEVETRDRVELIGPEKAAETLGMIEVVLDLAGMKYLCKARGTSSLNMNMCRLR